MYKDGEIIEVQCNKCGKVKKIKWHNKENFGRDTTINEIPGELGLDIKCDCGEKLELPEDC